VYFCLTNGKEFKIFQTNRGPEAEPVFQCKYENLRERLDIIKNILVPEVLLRDYPRREIDTHPSLGPGLRSIVRITHGEIVLTKNTLDLRPFVGLTMTITDGSVERNEDNQLEAYIETLVPFQSLQRLNEKLGLHVLRLKSAASSLSVDAANPTEFNSTTTHILPQGEMALNPLTWQEAPFPMNMRVETYTSATGYLDHHIFRGKFNAVLSYPEIRLTLGLEGTFRLHVS
jgi:hypothetical protein